MLEKSEVWRFLHHQVRIKIQGYGTGRLISEAMEQGVTFRNIEFIDETEIHTTIPREQLGIIKEISKSTFKITKLRERGISPRIEQLKRHKLFPVGIAVFICYFILQGLFIREIEIEGRSKITEKALRASLESQGLYEGCLKTFNCKEIEKNLFKDFDTIVWADVAYQGQYVQVRIAENNPYPEKDLNQDIPCKIVAEKSGYIEEIQAHKGKAKVKAGDYVKKGKTLIKGKIPIEYYGYQPTEDDPEFYYVHAKGKIIARIPYYYSFTMTKDGTKRQAKQRLQVWTTKNIPKNAQILNKSLNFTKKENIIRVYGIIETREEIGIEKEILIDQGNRRTEKDKN